MRDLRDAIRLVRREPSFVAGVTLTFALAIGANASMAGLVRQLMFAPPPGLAAPDRVARLAFEFGNDSERPFVMTMTSYPQFRAAQGIEVVFDAVAAERSDSMTVGTGESMVQVAAVAASGSYFELAGVRAARGRLFGPGDDEPPVGNDVVVLSWAYFQRRFAGDASAIGTELVVNGQPLVIVGVTPRGFNGTGLSPTDLFVPLSTFARTQGSAWWTSRGMRVLTIVARVAGGVTLEAAAAQATAQMRASAAGSGDPLRAVRLQSVVPGAESRNSAQGRIALALSAVSLAVLLIATANAGTLLRLRALRRRREVAVQVALGARATHLARRALAESLFLALLGAAGGLLLSRWLDGIVRATLLPNLAADEGFLDGTVLLASVALAIVAGLLSGLAPLSQALQPRVADELREGTTHGASGRLALQHVLVAGQVALSTVLLVGAGLFVRSLDRVRSQDLGFSTARLIHVVLDVRTRLGGAAQDQLHVEAVERVRQLPGVRRATVVQGMPFASHFTPPIAIPGHPLPPPNVAQLPTMYSVTPEYLGMMDVRLVRGRLFDTRDTRTSPLVVLINESMARTAWPDTDPIGRCVQAGFGGGPGMDPMEGVAYLPCREVVGIVRDSRARSLRTGEEERIMQYYVPFPQAPLPPMPDAPTVHALLVETSGPPARVASEVQRLIQRTSAYPVFARARPYQELIDPQLRQWRLGATLFSAFGLLALVIAGTGLYAAVSYLAAQRTREVGIRLALGGDRAGILALVTRDAVRMAGTGATVGVVLALAAAPQVADLLFNTSPRDPLVIGGSAAALLAIALAAAAWPAWRASRTSPMEVLRAGT